MAYVKVAAKLTTDLPIRNGYISRYGIGRDWEAAEIRDFQPGPQFLSADMWGQYSWLYNGEFEYLSPLKGIAPISKTQRPNMALSDWSVISGSWKETPSAGYLKTTYLHAYDGRPNLVATGEFGRIESVATFAPAIKLWMWRFPGDAADTDPATVEVHFLGNGGVPEYIVGFPARSLSGAYWQDETGNSDQVMNGPYLLGRPLGVTTYALIDQASGGGSPQKAQEAGEGAAFMSATIEFIDGWFLCRMSGVEQPWAFQGQWSDANDVRRTFDAAAMATGKLRIYVTGHTAMVAVAQLAYSTSSVLRPAVYMQVAPNVETTPSYRTVTGGAGTVTVAPEYSGSDKARPVVTFASGGSSLRSVLYNVQEYRAATIGGASSSETVTLADDSFKLYKLEGELTDKWRGATLTATIKSKLGVQVDEIKPNRWCKAEVSLDNGSAYTTLFTGYYQSIEKTRDPDNGPGDRSVATIHAVDGIEARLGHHQTLYHCSYEGWPVGDWFRHVLNRCGIPAALISVDAACEAMTLPTATLKGDRRFQFRPQEQVVAMLDMGAECRDLQWGQNQTGVYFIRPRPVHTAGAYSYTLDAASVTDTDIMLSVKAAIEPAEFFTALHCFVGRGLDMRSLSEWDIPAQATPTDLHYIGDYWPKVVIEPEYDDALTLVRRLWAQRTEQARMLYWTSHYHHDLLPDAYVRVQVPNIDIPTNSIYRVIHKRWSADPVTTRFEQELVGVLVEEGT